MEILINFFGTIFAGALTLVCIIVVFWIWSRSPENVWRWVSRKGWLPIGQDGIASHGIGALVLVSFGIGIVAEGMTDYMTDSETAPDSLIKRCLGSESEHRFRTLFIQPDTSSVVWRPKGLAKELFNTEHGRRCLSNILGPKHPLVADPNNYLVNVVQTNTRKHHLSFLERKFELVYTNSQTKETGRWPGVFSDVNQIYYPAKNWSSSRDHYSEELERLQMRIDWARTTFAIMSFVPAGAVVLCVLVSLITGTILGIAKPSKLVVSGERTFWRGLATLFVIVAVLGTSYKAYAQAEEQFNERAFGYFLSDQGLQRWTK
jgi:hypothetical protein